MLPDSGILDVAFLCTAENRIVIGCCAIPLLKKAVVDYLSGDESPPDVTFITERFLGWRKTLPGSTEVRDFWRDVGRRRSHLELERSEALNHVMKKLFAVMIFTAVVLFLMLPNLSWADDAAGTYKTKCAMCHGADGKGKANIPDLTSDKVKKATDAELTDFIANGGPSKKATHAFAAKGVDAKAMVTYIRSLK